MDDLSSIGLFARNYKSIGPEGGGFDLIKPINVVIGRNNSGKSALLDILSYACSPSDINEEHYHQRAGSEIFFSKKISLEEAIRVFRADVSGGDVPGVNHYVGVGRHLVGERAFFRIWRNGIIFLKFEDEPTKELNFNRAAYFRQFGDVVRNPFAGKQFKRLLADRDISAEVDSGILTIDGNGQGFTSTVAQILNKSYYDSSLIESEFLSHLNFVFEPDAHFEDILVQQHGNGKWEVYLFESSKGRIALSSSGSGLKTVFLVLAHLHIIPHIEKKGINDYIFAFEELENNLHPSLQRRLLEYIRTFVTTRSAVAFMTTHSSSVIDLFSSDESAQIIHVSHSSGLSTVNVVRTYIDNHGIIDDLDVRASDILQANCVVWVEGPTDRLYLNRWIELATSGSVKEGVHYQTMFYGGRLLSHLSASDPEADPEVAVKLLRINRHAIIVIDSDKRSLHSRLNDTKKRIVNEVKSFGGIAWVTKGKEIENYLPLPVLRRLNARCNNALGQFEDIQSYLDANNIEEGKLYSRSKVLFAEKVLPLFRHSDLDDVLDLKQRVDDVVSAIQRWNGTRPLIG